MVTQFYFEHDYGHQTIKNMVTQFYLNLATRFCFEYLTQMASERQITNLDYPFSSKSYPLFCSDGYLKSYPNSGVGNFWVTTQMASGRQKLANFAWLPRLPIFFIHI